MSKAFTVARWEFLEKVKTKSFIISLIVTPAIIILISVVPALLADRESDSTSVIGVIDTTGIFFSDLRDELEQYTISGSQPAYVLVNMFKEGKSLRGLKKETDSMVIKGKVQAALVITANPYSIEFRSLGTGSLRDKNRFERAFNKVKTRNSLLRSGIDEQSLDTALADVEIKQIKLDKAGQETESGFLEVFFSSIIFIMILAFVILSSGGMLIRSLVEEKSNRLIEILVSSCTPGELLTGKILGLSALALLQIFIWAAVGVFLAGSYIIPASAFSNILPMFVYFLLGFFFYTALFVGIGSVVTTEQEAQQVTGYLSLTLFLPMIFAITTIENPGSGLVKVLTYIPFTTPTIMLLKLNIKPVAVQEFISTVSIMLFSIIFVITFSAKIFRVGILSYGKLPDIKQLIQWLREK